MMKRIQSELLRVITAKRGRHGMSINHIRPIFMRKIQICNSQQKWQKHAVSHIGFFIKWIEC